MKQAWSVPARFYALTIVIILVVVVAWRTREMFTPLAIAGLIAYILNPIAHLLAEKTRIQHRGAVNIVYFVSLGLLIATPVVLVPVLLTDIETLSGDLLSLVDQQKRAGIVNIPFVWINSCCASGVNCWSISL